jgi:hypothetical protein
VVQRNPYRNVPWYLALPCNVLAGIALVVLNFDPHDNLSWALVLLGAAAAAMYGTAFRAVVARAEAVNFLGADPLPARSDLPQTMSKI